MVIHATHRTPSLLTTLHGFGAALTSLNLRMFDPHFQLYPGIPVGSSASSSVVTATAPQTATNTTTASQTVGTTSSPLSTTTTSAPTNIVRPQLQDNSSVRPPPHPHQDFITCVPRDVRRQVSLRRNSNYTPPHPYRTRSMSQEFSNPCKPF